MKWLFREQNALPLGVLRISLSAVLLFQALLLLPEVENLWGQGGLLPSQISQYFVAKSAPLLIRFDLISKHLHLLFAAYCGALLMLLIGHKTRWAAIAALVGHLLIKFNQGFASGYGVDTFAHTFLFYCCVFPVGDVLSVDNRNRQWVKSESYGFATRIMQIHLAIAYCSSGIAKAMGEQWQNGEVIWRALNLPQFHKLEVGWLAHLPWLALVLAWATLVLEIGYPVWMASERIRPWAAVAVVFLHVGIIFGLGLWTFGLLMIALNISLFLVPALASKRRALAIFN